MARRSKKTEEQMQLFSNGGSSQQDKSDAAFSEMEGLLSKGVTEQETKADGSLKSRTYKDAGYAAEDILRMLKAGDITLEQAENFLKSQKEAGNYAKGGMEDGGLKDEGGTVDPVSGNDVPVGSTQKEVRDDIPAQLSEGEFVFPADVTRYIGLENLMELRNKAKKGLAQMEAMGQMGNSEEATMDDTEEMDVDIDALIDEFDPNSPETMQFAMGGVVKAQPGGLIPGGQMPPQQFSYGYMPSTPPQQPIQYPQYGQMIQQPAQGAVSGAPAVEDRQYIGPNGELITIRFIDGKQQQNIPQGFKVYKPEEVQPEVVAPTVTPTEDGGSDGTQDTGKTAIDIGRSLTGKVDDPALQKAEEELSKFGLKTFGMAVAGLALGPAGAFGALKGREAEYNKLQNNYFKEVARVASTQNPDKYTEKGLYSRLTNPTTKVLDVAKPGTPVGFTDDTRNTYVDQDGLVRDTSGLSRETKAGLDIASQDAQRSGDGGDGVATTTGGKGSTSFGYDPSMSEDYGDQSGGNEGSSPGSDNTGGPESGNTEGSSFSKGGAVQQTQRALKSTRKK